MPRHKAAAAQVKRDKQAEEHAKRWRKEFKQLYAEGGSLAAKPADFEE